MNQLLNRKLPGPKVINFPAAGTAPKVNKFWNIVDNGDDTAELQLFGTISSEESWWNDDCVTYRNFINDLNALGEKSEINVLFHSCGGDVFAANAIYNALAANSAKITGTIIGMCASAATIVLMACDVRQIAKNGVLMAHNPSISLFGSYEAADLVKMAEVVNKVKDSIMAVYRDRLGKTDEEIAELMDNESWYVGQEAVDEGFCDEVVEESFANSITNVLNQKILLADGQGYTFMNYIGQRAPESIRQKVFDLSKTPQKTGTLANKNSQKGKSNMGENQNQDNQAANIENAAQLRAAYPDLVDEIVDEAVQDERDRLKAIDEIANGIPDAVLTKAKYDEPVSAADLALAQLRANNQAGQETLDNMIDDMKNSGAAGVGSVPNSGNDGGQSNEDQHDANVNNFAKALKSDKRRENK